MNNSRILGIRGEHLACIYLRKYGYKVCRRNFRTGIHEIDIIACKSGTLIFIEVKSRSSNSYGYPENQVTKSQQASILHASEEFLDLIQWNGNIRFDIISVEWAGSGHKLHHFKDAFY